MVKVRNFEYSMLEIRKDWSTVITMKTASKYLACMTGCWDPEFEPRVEEIVDYR